MNDIRIPFDKGSLDEIETDGTATQDGADGDPGAASQNIYAKEAKLERNLLIGLIKLLL